MRKKYWRITIAGCLLQFFCVAALADDVEDVVAADERIVELFNAGNAEEIRELVVEKYVAYNAGSPLLLDGREAFLGGFEVSSQIFEQSTFAVIGERKVRITGNTALVAGMWSQTWKPVDGPWRNAFYNNLSTYIKIRGKWRLASSMQTPLPNGTGP